MQNVYVKVFIWSIIYALILLSVRIEFIPITIHETYVDNDYTVDLTYTYYGTIWIVIYEIIGFNLTLILLLIISGIIVWYFYGSWKELVIHLVKKRQPERVM